MKKPDRFESALREYFVRSEGECPHARMLALWVSQSLSAEDETKVRRHIEVCRECQADLTALEGTPGRPESTFSWRPWGLGVALAASLLWAVPTLVFQQPDDLVSKGGFSVQVEVKRNEELFRASPSTALRAGDELSFLATTPEKGYLMVLYATEKEAPVRVAPALESKALSLQAGTSFRLNDRARVEEASDCEWFVAFWSPREFDEKKAIEVLSPMISGRSQCHLAPAAPDTLQIWVLGVQR